MPCDGNGNSREHCCWIRTPSGANEGEYNTCPHLIRNWRDETGRRRKWACGLRAELGNWDDVLADPRYPTGAWAPGVNCRDWPDGEDWNGVGCSVCGKGQ